MDYNKIAELDILTISECDALCNNGYRLEIDNGNVTNLVFEEGK